MCVPLNKLFQQIFNSCRPKKNRNGKKLESLLTPYEMDMVPLMLKELDNLDPRFYQMILYRLFKETLLVDQDEENKSESNTNFNKKCQLLLSNNQNLTISSPTASSSTSTTSSHRSGNIRFNKFINEGQALKNLIYFLACSLRDNGTFDEKCEKKIESYRFEWQEWCSENLILNNSSYNIKNSVTPSRFRSFSMFAAPTSVDNRFLSSTPNSSTSSNTSTLSTTSSLLGTTSPALTVVSPKILISSASLSIEEDDCSSQKSLTKNKKRYDIQRERPVATIIESETINNNSTEQSSLSVNKPTNKINKFKNISAKERRAAIKKCNTLFMKLSEILIHQFHTTIIVDGNQQLQNENLHERELKVIIWRHFIQMFTLILTQRIK